MEEDRGQDHRLGHHAARGALRGGDARGAAAGHDSLLGAVLNVGTQATLTALDVPDTRSWETLPARVAVARIRVPAGKHRLRLLARGAPGDAEVDVDPGGWAVVSLMALR